MPDYNVSDVDPRLYDALQTRTYPSAQNSTPVTPLDRIPPPKWQNNLIRDVQNLRTVRNSTLALA